MPAHDVTPGLEFVPALIGDTVRKETDGGTVFKHFKWIGDHGAQKRRKDGTPLLLPSSHNDSVQGTFTIEVSMCGPPRRQVQIAETSEMPLLFFDIWHGRYTPASNEERSYLTTSGVPRSPLALSPRSVLVIPSIPGVPFSQNPSPSHIPHPPPSHIRMKKFAEHNPILHGGTCSRCTNVLLLTQFDSFPISLS
ncbi:hypothetical protein BDP55DRAFT_637642 [Colletotrichum godetiae]|uniref:Uncharacterized protein n=1 Tax=Colletotrichum godetiae TaxID=1209918 RepID=A0AAJ0EPL8_9PEZI|nr:uncharacterized protein BDP55DRAFT_637642 [Colletotrichum godetiae]KAK1658682.1 hypothetical protein BDP55DRAFT_637642 [Colletotrichum godetiae]